MLTRKAEAPQGARLNVWHADPASNRHIPGPGAEGVAFSDAFRESVDGIMNARAFLRWAAVNVLLGSWDNY